MKKILFLTLFYLISLSGLSAQVVITEIMYNPPENFTDSLEFVELFNAGTDAVNLEGYYFGEGIDYTFSDFTLDSGAYVVISVDSVKFANNYNTTAFQWFNGALGNGGELIQLNAPDSSVVDEVDYDDGDGWPSDADGRGPSLVLCNPLSDNDDPANWQAASTSANFAVAGREVFANPGTDSDCLTGPIAEFQYFDYELNEENETFSIPVILRNGDGMVHQVAVNIDNSSSADDGDDYSIVADTLTFLATFTADTQYVEVTIEDDALAESIESIVFNLEAVGTDLQVNPVRDQYTLNILDNDTRIPLLVISEIMYNPAGNDALEYLELANADSSSLDVTGFTFSQGIEFTFPSMTLAPGEHVVIAKDTATLSAAGYTGAALQWTSGALGNSGETIELRSSDGLVVDEVTYDDGGDWPSEADGSGPSLILCDLMALNNDPANWRASGEDSGITGTNGTPLLASPGAENDCDAAPDAPTFPLRDIGTISTNDASGIPDSVAADVTVIGTVYGINTFPAGVSFTIIDDSNDGIAVFNGADNLGYTVVEGDRVQVAGYVAQFNGLTQINAEEITLLSSDNPLVMPTTVTSLGEDTESQLITLLDVELVDASQWTNTGNFFTVDITDGTNTYTMFIDADSDIFGTPAPDRPFNLTGIGGQFDSSIPYDEGYQIYPRYLADIDLISSVQTAESLPGLILYPNPVVANFRVESPEVMQRIDLFAADGRRLLSVEPNSKVWQHSVMNLPAGLYQVKVQIEGQAYVLRMVK